MSLEDLLFINKRVFGVSEPMIQLFKPNIIPLDLSIGDYDNLFIYTGGRSVLHIEENGALQVYFYFDNYICLGDISSHLGSTSEIKGLYAQTSLSVERGFTDNGQGYDVYFPYASSSQAVYFQRGYLLRYPNTRRLKQ